MDLTFEPMTAFSFDELASIQNKAFEGYIVPLQLNSVLLSGLVRTSGIDLACSFVASRDGEPAGLALIARRGWLSRLAGMAVMPEFRGKRVGATMMPKLIEDARARGERGMVLEAFEQNEPAVRLYQRAGFRIDRRLVGYRLDNPAGADEELEEVDPFEVVRAGAAYEDPQLPWQLASVGFQWLGRPSAAFQVGPARAVVSDPTASTIVVRYVVVPHGSRNQGHASRLLRALFAAFPDRSWRIPPIVPEGLAHGLLTRVGFKLEPLAQVEMSLSFEAGGNSEPALPA